MNNIEYMGKILVYFVIGVSYFILMDRISNSNTTIYFSIIKLQINVNWSLLLITIVYAVLFALYSTQCGREGYQGDRGNYALNYDQANFDSFLKSSHGLFYVVKLLKHFSLSSGWLFFTISFLNFILIVYAYEVYIDKASIFFAFLACSLVYAYSFYLLKQTIAIALVAIGIALLQRKKYLESVLIVFLACFFHESALIAFPLMLALILVEKYKMIRILVYICSILAVVCFKPLVNCLVVLVLKYAPILSNQIAIYLGENGRFIFNENWMTVVKGAPFYLVTFMAFMERKSLSNKISFFEGYTLCSFFSGICSILSGYFYWAWRFGAYGYIPTFIFASLICKYDNNKHRIEIFKALLIFSLLGLTGKYLAQVYIGNGGF